MARPLAPGPASGATACGGCPNGASLGHPEPAEADTRPILPSADLETTARFYEPLGFRVAGQWRREYLIVEGPDGIELHFWHKHDVDRWTNDVACWIGYPDADAVRERHDAWAQAAIPEPARLNDVDEGAGHLVEFQLIDPHGNLVRLGAPKG